MERKAPYRTVTDKHKINDSNRKCRVAVGHEKQDEWNELLQLRDRNNVPHYRLPDETGHLVCPRRSWRNYPHENERVEVMATFQKIVL